MIRILIVEDHGMLRDALESLLNAQDDMEVVGGTDSVAKAPELCEKLNPDIVLMDIITSNNSSGIYTNGIRCTTEIRRKLPDIKIVIMTGLPDINFAEDARKAGAHSFIKKDMGIDHLLFVIRSTMKGTGIYPGPDNSPFSNKFTEREIVIIRLICKGMGRGEMAKILNISEAMIKKQITSILNKTGFDSIGKFAIFAVSQGLVTPEIH